MDSSYDSTYYTTSYSSDASAAGAAIAGGVLLVFFLIYFAIIAVMVVSMWKLFTKAGKPGWAAIVPIYNTIIMLEISGRPVWWLLLMMFVPFFGAWVAIVAIIDFAKSYGKSTGFGVLVALVPIVGYPMLAFGKNSYVGPAAAGLSTFTPAPDRAPGAPANPYAAQPAAPSYPPQQPAAPAPAPGVTSQPPVPAPADPNQPTQNNGQL